MQMIRRILQSKGSKITLSVLCGSAILFGTVASLMSPEYLFYAIAGIGGLLAVG